MKKAMFVCCLLLASGFTPALSQDFKSRSFFDQLPTKLRSVKWLSNYDPSFGGGNEFYKLSKEFLRSYRTEDFEQMVDDRNPVVRAMGLLCLAQVAVDSHFLILLSQIKDKEEVSLSEGCLISKITVGEFARRLLRNPYMLEAEGRRPAR